MYVLLVTIVMIVSGTFIVTLVRNDTYERLRVEFQSAASSLKTALTELSDKEELEKELIEKIQEQGIVFKDKVIYLLDAKGNTIYTTARQEERKEKLYTRGVMAATRGETTKELDRVYSEDLDGNTVLVRGYAEPVLMNDGTVNFILYIQYSVDKMDAVETTLNGTIVIILLAVIFAILLASLLGFLFSKNLTGPIIALTVKARDIAKGDFNQSVHSIDVRSGDEIGELAKTFNYMAEELNTTMSEITSEKNKLETVFTHMADGILVFDTNGNLIHSNPAAYNMLEVTELGNTFDQVFKYYADQMDFNVLNKLEKNRIKRYLIPVNDNYINICFATYTDRAKHSIGLIAVLQDVTEQKKLEEMQKEFVANVSHELRTPLTTIKSYAETLTNGAMEEKEIANNFLGVINHEADRMTALVQDLLELSRLDNKQTKFDMKLILLNEIVEQSIQKYQIHAQKKYQNMRYHDIDHQYKIIGDASRIEQVIKNVVSNAVKYSPEHADIDVRLVDKKDKIEVQVQDTGFGIPKEDLPRIFERFYRVDKARSRAMGGTGLGLAIAKEIMDCHGGDIRVESEDGNGTIFYLDFPIEDVN